jgi:hypothetical protein
MSYQQGDSRGENTDNQSQPGAYGAGQHFGDPAASGAPTGPGYPSYGQGYAQYPGGYGQPGYPQAGGFGNTPQGRSSFFGALFDFKFTQFVTLRVIPVLYVLSLTVITLAAVVYFFIALLGGAAAFSDEDAGAGVGILLLLVAFVVVPLVWLIYVVISRVVYEFFISVIKIAENTDPANRR